MPTTVPRLTFNQSFAYTLIVLIALGYLFNIGQGIICPLLLAMLFAILMRPVASFMQERMRIPNTIASLAAVVVFSLIIIGIFYFISTQVASMADDWDKIKGNLVHHYQHIQAYISDTFKISKAEQDNFIKESQGKGKEFAGSTLLSFTDMLGSAFLIPIYMFLMLLYRTHFATFLTTLFATKHHAKLHDVISTIKISVQSYILGLMVELLLVSALTAIGLLIIGVKYALLLGLITGILNLIPYVGIFVALAISIVASMTGSSDLSAVIGIIIVNIVVQLIDNNVLMPLVVSSKVEVNSLATIVGIIIAGSLAGISGMFLAIPLIAIAKVIFYRIDSLKAWGYLLGDDVPKSFSWVKRRRKPAIEKIIKD